MYNLSGYVLEPVRIGQSNGVYTYPPSNIIHDQGAFTDFFTNAEGEPETSYCVLVVVGGNLTDARFAWVRNDQTTRFEYSSGSFRPVARGLIGDQNQAFIDPIPQTGEFPLLRIGFGSWLDSVIEVPDESSFSPNPTGAEWALSSGRVKLNSSLQGNCYCDGVVNAYGLSLPRQNLGTLDAPSSIVGLPAAGGDLVFLTANVQFPVTKRVEVFSSSIPSGTVEVKPNGDVQFSPLDVAAYGSVPVSVVFGDLPIEHGVSVRFYRNPVNLDGAQDSDVSVLYDVVGAVLADPIIASPIVFLPAVPNEDYPVEVYADPGTGAYVGPLLNFSESIPVAPGISIGVVVDSANKQLRFAKRVNELVIPIEQATSALPLPDGLIEPGIVVEVETFEGSGIYQPVSYSADLTGGLVLFTTEHGARIDSGTGQFIGANTFEDPLGITAQPGDLLLAGAGLFSVIGSSGTQVTTTENGSPGVRDYTIIRDPEALTEAFFELVPVVNPAVSVTRTRGLVSEEVPYRLQAPLGVFEVDPLLEGDSLTIDYESDGLAFSEPAAFRVRNELVQDHPVPTSILSYNPQGRPVDLSRPVTVRRGGRVVKNVVVGQTTIVFSAEQMTSALPHGSVIDPGERVYVDYWVTTAAGGEKSVSVGRSVDNDVVSSGGDTVRIVGDYTGHFLAGDLVRVGSEIFEVLNVSLDGALTVLQVAGAAPTFTNPLLYRSSMPEFVIEASSYEPVTMGSNQVRLLDARPAYRAGLIIRFGQDYYELVGAVTSGGGTTITISPPARKQYVGAVLERSAYALSSTQFQLEDPPLDPESVILWKKSDQQVGVVLTKDGFQINASGQIRLYAPLAFGEGLYASYVGSRTLGAGPSVRASYTATISPSTQNGLLGQVLKINYVLASPDTFYYRVVPITQFRGEFLDELEARAAGLSSGPVTSNAGSIPLREQGQKSIWFDELHVQNNDLICADLLKSYNDLVNALEDMIQVLDGRVVGQADGRVAIDGNSTTYPPLPLVTVPPGPAPSAIQSARGLTNQIDDVILTSPYPIVSLSPTTFTGTWAMAWEPGPASRFYPTTRVGYGLSVAGADTGAVDGTIVLDLGVKPLSSVSVARTRSSRARVVLDYPPGTDTYEVSSHGDTDEFLRPAFQAGMAVDIIAEDGSPIYANTPPDLVTPSAPTITVLALLSSPDRIQLSSASPSPVPRGSTIRSPELESLYGGAYTPFGKSYALPADLNAGTLVYSETMAQPPNSGERLQARVKFQNQLLAPYRFPAADGIAEDDSGDESLPLVHPDLFNEISVADDQTDLLSSLPPLDLPTGGVGSLDITRTIITAAVPWVAPVPQVYDLVRITSGLNNDGRFRRVLSVGVDSLTVDEPFDTFDTGFDFLVSTSTSVVSGSGSVAGSTLSDPLASFALEPGYTVVIESGLSAGDRRQIVSYTGTTISVDAPFSANGPVTYRVDKSLVTFSAWGSLGQTISDEGALLDSGPIPSGVQPFLTAVAQVESLVLDVLVTGSGSAAGAVWTDPFADFSGVIPGDVLTIPTGAGAGRYEVLSVDSQTQLTVSPSVPSMLAFYYEVAVLSGISLESLLLLDTARDYCVSLVETGAEFQTGLSPAPVVVTGPVTDPNIYANGLTAASFLGFSAVISGKAAALAAIMVDLESVLRARDRLYDKRWSWVVGRLHMLDGTLPGIGRAETTRKEAQAQILSQLTQVNSV